MKVAVVVLAILVGLSSMAVASDGEQPTKFKITTKRKDDSVEVRAEKDRTVFSVKSPFGISQAVIEREGEKWPKVVALRLHLKGLESVRACNGMATLDAAVSVQDGKPTVRSWKDGKRTPCWARKA